MENLTKILKSPHLIHQRIPSTPEETEKDWHDASIYFASEVLEGRINLAYQIGEQFYQLLSQIWLDEVRHLKAYFIWEDNGDGWNPEEADKNYLEACARIREMLFKEQIKVSKNRFEKVKLYLDNRYLDNGKLAIEKTHSQDLIRSKAYRIWETSGKQVDEFISWKLAEEYVRMFYESIIPAVMKEDPESTIESLSSKISAMIEMFREHNLSGCLYRLINCFEAAIATYFIDSDTLNRLWNDLEKLI
jgi:hypothetical protein